MDPMNIYLFTNFSSVWESTDVGHRPAHA